MQTIILWVIRKLPFATPVISFVRKNCLLVSAWIVLALLLIVMGFTFSLWSKAKENELNLARAQIELIETTAKAEKLERDIGDAVTANVNLSESLRNLTDLASTDVIVNKLVVDVKKGLEDNARIRKTLKDLEESREEVKKYLDSHTPIDFSCLRTNTCNETPARDQGSHTVESRKTSTPLGSSSAYGSNPYSACCVQSRLSIS